MSIPETGVMNGGKCQQKAVVGATRLLSSALKDRQENSFF
jgi:hypothetical protein